MTPEETAPSREEENDNEQANPAAMEGECREQEDTQREAAAETGAAVDQDDMGQDAGDQEEETEDNTGEEAESAETGQEDGEEGPEEMKMVLHVREGQASAAVWRAGADPHIEVLQDTSTLEDALPQMQDVIKRAQARWNESPMRPKYNPPKKAGKKAREKAEGNVQTGQDRQEAGNEAAATPGTEPQRQEMLRLF